MELGETKYYRPKSQRKVRTPMSGLTYFLLLFVVISAASCSKQSYYDIDTRSDIHEDGNYVIRWQVNPGMAGDVKIYASTDADRYPTQPVATENIKKEQTTIVASADRIGVQFFLMVFDGRESRVVSSRTLPTQSITNFRDFGGYMTIKGDQIRWGMLYRSGRVDNITQHDSLLLNTLGIRSQLVMADDYSIPQDYSSSLEDALCIVLNPETKTYPGQFLDKIQSGSIDQSGVVYYREDLFDSYAFENTKQFSTALHYLLDPSHYPILISDRFGKERAAFLVMLVQSALGVSQADIISDYMLSNQQLVVEKLIPGGYKLSPKIQEAVTEFFQSRENDLQALFFTIRKKYGSMDNYLKQELDFDADDCAKLQSILYY